ncbi:MAG: radical SAM protein [bacterium]
MKVLLVQAHTGRKEPEIIFPLELAYLAGALTTTPYHHTVRIIDLNIESDPYGSLSDIIQSFLPDVIGISQPNLDTADLRDPYIYLQTLQPTLQLIRRLIPETIIIAGGSGFSLFPERIIDRIPEIDFGVYLEGEQSLPELLSQLTAPQNVPGIWYRKDRKILFSGIRLLPGFDKISRPQYALLDMPKYCSSTSVIGIESKRGCLLSCIYCVSPQLQGTMLRLRPPQSVVDDIEWLVKTYQIPGFVFVDSIFNLPKEHAIAICQEIIDRKLSNISWSAYFDIAGIDADFIRLAKSAGCTDFYFSPDAITDSALKALQKNYTITDIQNTMKLCRSIPGVVAEYSFYLNAPGLTFGGYLKTLWYFIFENIRLGLRRKGSVRLAWLRILPKTELQHLAIQQGFITPETDLLPENEKDLKSVYYLNPKFRILDYLALRLIGIIYLIFGELTKKKD